MPAPSLEIGQIINVRALQYLVESVTPPIHPERDTLVSLVCLNDDVQGQVFWEREIDAQILGNSTWDVQRLLHNWVRPHWELGKKTTPAMAMGFIGRPVTISEILISRSFECFTS